MYCIVLYCIVLYVTDKCVQPSCHVILRVTAVNPTSTTKVHLKIGDQTRMAMFNVDATIKGKYSTELVYHGALMGPIQANIKCPNVDPAGTSLSLCLLQNTVEQK